MAKSEPNERGARGSRARPPASRKPTTDGLHEARRATKLVDRAHDQIEELIVTLRMAPGSTWSEQSLTEQLGIGRTPVREAIQQLAAAHLVNVIPRHGIKVSEVSAQEYLLVLEIRRELDRLIATRAARRAWPEEKKRIASHAEKMLRAARANDAVTFMREQLASRQAVVAATRNSFLAAATKPLDSLSRRFFFYLHKAIGYDLEGTAIVYTAVLQAIASGDEAKAAETSDSQIEFAERRAKQLLGPQP